MLVYSNLVFSHPNQVNDTALMVIRNKSIILPTTTGDELVARGVPISPYIKNQIDTKHVFVLRDGDPIWQVLDLEINNIKMVMNLLGSTAYGGIATVTLYKLLNEHISSGSIHSDLLSPNGIVVVEYPNGEISPIQGEFVFQQVTVTRTVTVYRSEDHHLALLALKCGGRMSYIHVKGPLVSGLRMLNPPKWFADKHPHALDLTT